MNILLVDDHRVLLDSLSFFIKSELPNSTIFKAGNGFEAIKTLQKEAIQIVLLDVNMPFMNGIEVAHEIHSLFPTTKIIMLTSIEGKAMMASLVQVVHGFLFKDVNSSEIIAAINTVMAGDKYYCKEANQTLIDSWEIADNMPDVKFDKRETAIIELMAAGKTNPQIAEILGLKENIVNQYRDSLLRKTKTKNTKELIAFAFQNGLIFPKK